MPPHDDEENESEFYDFQFLRSRMAKAGLGKVAELRGSKVVPRIEQIYERVLL